MLSTTELPVSHLDLLNAPNVAALATTGPDGRPQVTAVWYLLEDGQLRLTMRTDRQKAKNLQARPAATLFFVDPANTFRTLEVRAHAELDPDDEYAFADRLGKKYDADLRSFDQAGDCRVMVTLHPIHVNRRD